MEFTNRNSGLAVPQSNPPQRPKPPKRPYRVTEIQDEEKRELASKALLQLWDAMDLSNSSRIHLPNSPSNEMSDVHWQIYHFVGELILGEDCPEREVFC